MSSLATSVGISYFGKLPGRRDFVKSNDNHQLLSLLDRWAEQGLEMLARDVDWKRHYDAVKPMHFAFLGTRNRVAIAGHFAASRDTSSRRYPFLSATRLDIAHPLTFITRSPLALARLWARLERQTQLAIAMEDPGDPLRELAGQPVSMNLDPGAYDASFADFLDLQTLGSLETMLAVAGHRVSLRRMLPALGLLLRPVLAQPGARLDRGLSLPLPQDALYRPLVATFWMDLVTGFIARSEVELACFVGTDARPSLTLGFNGAQGRTLHALLDPRVGEEHHLRIDDAEWVDDALEEDYALRKLGSYLAEADLSLQVARATFRETFFGG